MKPLCHQKLGYRQMQMVKHIANAIAVKLMHGYDPQVGYAFTVAPSETARAQSLVRRGWLYPTICPQQFTASAAFCEMVQDIMERQQVNQG